MAHDVSTQDILGTLRTSGEADNLFFLYIATPGGAPSRLHQHIIKPLLQGRGWKKVSVKTTGFRALYFLDLNDVKDYLLEDDDNNNNHRRSNNDTGIEMSANEEDDENVFAPLKKKAKSCPLDRAREDRIMLKEAVEKYKKEINGTFSAHVILCRPLDYEEDFNEMMSQPNSIEH